MKKILLYITFLFVSANLWSQVSITETGGWLESAFVKWKPVAGADSYNVYYTGAGQTDKKIDTQLIRSYGSYFRADVLGLAAGSYTITIKPVTANVEGSGGTTSTINVKAHDRSGFAFEGGRVPGAYNTDGTLKSNAVVIYITQNTKNTVSLIVTGATTNPCVGLQTILDGFKKGNDTRPLAVRLIGNITDLNYMLGGDLVIENKNNANSSITFEGIGSDAVANGWGLRIKTASNIEVRNLGFMLTDADEGDNVGLQQANDHIWVHNCDMFYGAAGGDNDQVKGDGAMDAKKSTYITFSYNHFWDSGKCNLLGLSENTTAGLYITYHHNWYDHSDSRHPRVRFYSAHVYNNYYDGNSKYGAGSTLGSSVFMEANFFRNSKYPMLTSMQGTDVFGGAKGTFSDEDGGTIKAFNNIMSGQSRYAPYNASTNPIEFDAVEVTTRNETIPNTIKSKSGANTYNNFDTNPAVMYTYTPDSPEDAKDKVMQYAGRVSGGDLKYTFNNAIDDTSDAVNIALKSALTNYTSGIVYIQGETPVVVNTQTLTLTGSNDQTVASGTAISDIVYTWGGDATNATVTGLPASGIDFITNPTSKTITVSGTPTADVSFSVITSGTSGTPEIVSGNITVLNDDVILANEIHNFTTATPTAMSSSFYTIKTALKSNPGTVTYNGLTLTVALKIDSSGEIKYTTLKESTLTLVFNAFSANKNIKVNNKAYTIPSNGVLIIPSVAAGTNTITRDNTEIHLYYIETSYGTLGINDNVQAPKLNLYPNPVKDQLYFSTTDQNIKSVTIFNLLGTAVKTILNVTESVDVSNLSTGSYLVRVTTDTGSSSHKIIKK